MTFAPQNFAPQSFFCEQIMDPDCRIQPATFIAKICEQNLVNESNRLNLIGQIKKEVYITRAFLMRLFAYFKKRKSRIFQGANSFV